jgi:hypothetical protein
MNLEQKIAGKNIIFFSVQTFNLENEIIKKLEEFGAKVDYFDERPSNSNFSKGIIRLNRSVFQHRIDSYYKKILSDTLSKEYHFLFVNRGEVIPSFFLKEFKKIHTKCIFIFYTWDSFTNHSHPTSILRYFDKKFTFDSDDALNYKIQFRPLFFLDAYQEIIKSKDASTEQDLLFLGTAHSDRYSISNEISQWCEQNNLKMFCYYYMHGRLVYFYKKLFDKTFKKFDFSKLSFKSLTTDEIAALYEKSNIILDINHPGQKGLTMRTLESVGAKKKLITTNSEIKKYPFYNSNNIFVIDRNNIQLNKFFFETKYEEIDSKLYDKMSIAGWLKEIFEEDNANTWINGI